MRRRNVNRYLQNRNLEERFANYLMEHLDRYAQVVNQSWALFHKLPDDQVGHKIALLNTINGALCNWGETMGIEAPTIDELVFTQQLEKLLADLEEIRQKLKVRPHGAEFR